MQEASATGSGGPSWGDMGPSWGRLGRTWNHLGAILGQHWTILGQLGVVWGQCGAILVTQVNMEHSGNHLEANLRPFWANMGQSWRNVELC